MFLIKLYSCFSILFKKTRSKFSNSPLCLFSPHLPFPLSPPLFFCLLACFVCNFFPFIMLFDLFVKKIKCSSHFLSFCSLSSPFFVICIMCFFFLHYRSISWSRERSGTFHNTTPCPGLGGGEKTGGWRQEKSILVYSFTGSIASDMWVCVCRTNK